MKSSDPGQVYLPEGQVVLDAVSDSVALSAALPISDCSNTAYLTVRVNPWGRKMMYKLLNHKTIAYRAAPLLLCLGALVPFDAAFAQDENAPAEAPLEEILVIASKRGIVSERDFAGSITALSGDDLDARGANGFGEIFKNAAGINLNPARAGLDAVSIRGITSTTDASQIVQTTVGVYIHDVPMSIPGSDFSVSNPYPFDMRAVEILKGPQGALYGSGSMGGAINYVAAKPDYEAIAGSVGGAYAGTRGGDASNTLRGMLNLPVSEGKAALRAVGYREEKGGYINNTGVGVENANEVAMTGGRLMLGVSPNENWEILASVHHQKVEEDDNPGVFLSTWKEFERSTFILSPLDTEYSLGNLQVKYDGSRVSFISSTGYLEKKIGNPQDISRFITPGLNGLIAFTALNTGGAFSTVDMAFSDFDSEVEALSQEFRLYSNNDDGFNWMIGAFYQDTENTTASSGSIPGLEDALNLADGAFGITGTILFPNDLLLDLVSDENSEEIAVFAEVSFDLSESVELIAGGRYYDNEIDASRFTNSFGAQTTVDSSSSHDGFLPKVVLAFSANDNAMWYARASKGYRNGGENLLLNPLTGEPFPSFDPDEVWNYELGVKSQWADGRVRFDAAVFMMRWDDIQLPVLDPATNFGFTANVGKAESRGAELRFQWAPNDVFTLTSAGSYVDATLENDVTLPTGPVESGVRLPGTPEIQLSNDFAFAWPVRDQEVTARLTHKYKSDQFNDLSTSRTRLPGYTTIDASVGIGTDRYNVTLYGRNLGDTDARESQILLSAAGDPDVYVVRPREIGLQLNLFF